jgi:MSHA biogenesis protein MshN
VANVTGAMLILATSMDYAGDTTTPRKADKPARRVVTDTPSANAVPTPAAAPESKQPAVYAELRVPAPVASPILAATAVQESGSIRVEQSTLTPAERNVMEVQHAAELLRRGSLVEAEASLRGVLANDRSMLAARQALFNLLQRQQRFDEARALLKEGVALAPTQASLLLPYARLLAARGEWAAAYDALAPASEALAQDAEYRGLCGVVLQRLGRFPQSVADYRAAVKLAPTASAWWVGLGLSLEGDGRPGEARAAYLQARATSPGPEMAQFVENKLARSIATE